MLTNKLIEQIYKTSHQNPLACNSYKIPINYIEPTEAGVAEMNALLKWVREKDICQLTRTKKGYIKQGIEGLGFYLEINKFGAELVYNGAFQLKVRFKHLKQKYGKGLTGSEAFNMFNKLCKEFGLDMWDDWKLENSKYKEEIESPIRWLNPIYKDKVIEHAYHIDGNNMWFGCFIEEFPKYKGPVMKLYKEKCTTTDKDRKQDIKDIFTHTLGYCQSIGSKKMKAGLAQYAKAGINGCNHKIMKLVDYYKDKVIAINTDGIWLSCMPNIDHLGSNIGEFKLDHKNCKFRGISANKYEFIEDGVYKPVISGLTKRDKVQPDRSTWGWGSIYDTDTKVHGACYDEKTKMFEFVDLDDLLN